MKQYYLSVNDQPVGPFTLEELAGRGLTPNTLIWHEEMPDWKPASAVSSVQSLLPKLPPPIPRASFPPSQGSAIHNSSAQLPPPAIPVTRAQVRNFRSAKKWWVVGGAVTALCILVLMGFIHDSNIPNRAAYALPVTELDQNNLLETSNAPAVQTAQEQREEQRVAAEAQQAAEATAREAKRAWTRKHFLEYASTEILPGYTYRLIGGVSSGYFQFTNSSGYRLQNISVIPVTKSIANPGHESAGSARTRVVAQTRRAG